MRQVTRKAAIDLARDRGCRIDQDGMALGATGQEKRRAQLVAIRSGERDIIGKNVVQRSFEHRDPPCFFFASSKCEFSFCRKGLSWEPILQLAVHRQPVYNAALYFPV